jgi:DNA-binding MarR family transcriptional regulator
MNEKLSRGSGALIERPESSGSEYLASELAELLIQAAKKIRNGMVERLAPTGLTFAQAKMIRHIARYGDGPMCMRDFADLLQIAPRSVTALADALESDGYIARLADKEDRRRFRLHLTERGREVFERSQEARRDSAEEMLSPLSSQDREILRSLLERLDEPNDAVGAFMKGSAC